MGVLGSEKTGDGVEFAQFECENHRRFESLCLVAGFDVTDSTLRRNLSSESPVLKQNWLTPIKPQISSKLLSARIHFPPTKCMMEADHKTSVELIAGVRRLTWLAAANLVVMAVLLVALVALLIPKLERAVSTTERVEARFQSFADDVQPVVGAGAGKAVEAIKQMDAKRLSETATESSDETIRALGERLQRYLDRDKNETDD